MAVHACRLSALMFPHCLARKELMLLAISPCCDASVPACRPQLDPEPAHSAAPRPAVEAETWAAAAGSSTGVPWTDDLAASDLPLPASALRQVASGNAGIARSAGSGKQALGGGVQQQAGMQRQEPLPGAALSCG